MGPDRDRTDAAVGRQGRLSDRAMRPLVRVLSYRPDVDGRLLALGVVGVYLLSVAISRIYLNVDVWPALGVPSGPSPFFDTRNVLAALECRRLGFDPLVENPCDPWGRPMNYPRVWLLLRFLGLNQSHTEILAVAFIALFLVSLFFLVGRVSLGEGAILAVAVCSPAVMLAIERANMDIVVFSILTLGVLVWRRHRQGYEVVSPLIVFAAATAKIYPVFGLGAFFFTGRRRAAAAAIVGGVAFLVYAAVTWSDILAVVRTAPQGQHFSFGARILPAALYHLVVPERLEGNFAKQLIAILPLLVAGPVVWMFGLHRRPPRAEALDDWSLLAFHVGSLLFLGTFALTNSFDYRLVFLLLTLPRLFRWAQGGSGEPRAALAGWTLSLVILLLWVGAFSEPLALTDELVTWAVAGLIVALLAASIFPGLVMRVLTSHESQGPRDLDSSRSAH
jgi:Glycosyltransferase family 87